MKDVLKGELTRLSALDPEEISKAFARWRRDSEFLRLISSNTARMDSAKASQKWMEEELKDQTNNQHWFSIRALADDKLLGDGLKAGPTAGALGWVGNWFGGSRFVS